MKWPPTDLQILEEIYRRYYNVFVEYSKKTPNRATKVYVPIDIKELAEHFGIDGDIVFGRLYYHLEPKYGFTKKDNSNVHFFTLKAGEDTHAVQFPLLAAVIAELREDKKKHLIATLLSIAALIVSAISVGIALAQ
jgi:hypothetical protein